MRASEYRFSRAEWEQLILQWVFKERDRAILVRRLLDGRTIEQLAEEFDLSPQRIKKILQDGARSLQGHI